MFIKAIIFFLLLPGIVAFLIPLSFVYFSGIDKFQWAGSPVVISGLVLLLWCVRDFYIVGKGTLAPWAPPKKIVIIGLYRYMRNPMYAGVLILVLGWSILFQSMVLLAYAGILFLVFHIRVLTNEEPWLNKTFGEEWQSYKNKVPRWLPHISRRKKLKN
jgi:protein-S-isoprenylcysteine O-methyltransferase Ste14